MIELDQNKTPETARFGGGENTGGGLSDGSDVRVAEDALRQSARVRLNSFLLEYFASSAFRKSLKIKKPRQS